MRVCKSKLAYKYSHILFYKRKERKGKEFLLTNERQSAVLDLALTSIKKLNSAQFTNITWPLITEDLMFRMYEKEDYILLKLSNLACSSLSIPPSSFAVDSAWATLVFAAGADTADEGAFNSCALN